MQSRMSSDMRALVRDLKPGYSVEPVPNRIGRWYVVSPDGTKVRTGDGSGHIVLGKAETRNSLQRMRSWLEQAGAMQRTTRRVHGQSHEVRCANGKGQGKGQGSASGANPIVLAREVLRNTRSTPKERALARAYLDLLDKHEQVRALAANLGHQLREHMEPSEVYTRL